MKIFCTIAFVLGLMMGSAFAQDSYFKLGPDSLGLYNKISGSLSATDPRIAPFLKNVSFYQLSGRSYMDFDEQGRLQIREYYFPTDKYQRGGESNYKNSFRVRFTFKKKDD